MTKKFYSRLLPITAVAIALSSCIEVTETVHLKVDGSGTIVEETIMGAQMSAMIAQMAALGGEGAKAPDMFGEDAAKKRAEKMGKNVTVGKVEKIDKDGRTGARVTYNFTDINTVTLSLSDGASGLSGMAPDSGENAEKKEKKEVPVTFTYKDKVLTMINPTPQKAEGGAKDAGGKDAEADAGKPKAEEGAEAAQAQAMAMNMMKDMRMSLKVVIDSGIAETDATFKDGNTITLTEMDMNKLLANPDAMKKLQNLNPQDPAEMQENLKGMEGVKVETKDKVTVKLK